MTPPEQWKAIAAAPHIEYTNYEIRDQEGTEIATVYARTDGQTAKVARLLASAPKMLAALKELALCLEAVLLTVDLTIGSSEAPGEGRVRTEAALVAARAAIKAAEAESAASSTLAEVAEQFHQRFHRYAEVDWRDCPQDPCPERARIVLPLEEADRLRRD